MKSYIIMKDHWTFNKEREYIPKDGVYPICVCTTQNIAIEKVKELIAELPKTFRLTHTLTDDKARGKLFEMNVNYIDDQLTHMESISFYIYEVELF